jgi:hypothetical protein
MNSEPVLILGAVNAIIMLAVGFGLKLTTEQITLVNAAATAITAVIIRQNVSPLQK